MASSGLPSFKDLLMVRVQSFSPSPSEFGLLERKAFRPRGVYVFMYDKMQGFYCNWRVGGGFCGW